MKKSPLILFTAALTLFSCSSHEDATEFNIPINKDSVKVNAERLFGTIDSNQDWNTITQGSVTIKADANMNDIVKVQILTESPFGNENVYVLNEAEPKNGEATLVYDAPNICEELFAACVNSKGQYIIKVFTPEDKVVSFSETASARMTRAEVAFPSASSIVLGEPIKSFNALRAEESLNTGTTSAWDNVDKSKNPKLRFYEVWNDSSWVNDRLWSVASSTDGIWTANNGSISRDLTQAEKDEDMSTVKAIVETYLNKTGGKFRTNNKRNNWAELFEGNQYFNPADKSNYMISTGDEPVTVTPIQMNSTEGSYNSIYYYYFNPEATKGMTPDEEANYIKALPKFKVAEGYYSDKFKRNTEYLLPYYGDGTPTPGQAAVSCIIPKGYKIGFLNSKDYRKAGDISICGTGCTYGDGRLNYEVNHLMGHFFSAVDNTISQDIAAGSATAKKDTRYGQTEYGFTWDSPRILIFSANERTYLCFEDGCDCTFCDMVLEIKQGVKIEDEEVNVEAATYTMSFEDEPEHADYDMNDVVLQVRRINDTKINVSVVALGGYDQIMLQGIGGPLENKELHEFFGVEAGKGFINTEKNQDTQKTKDKGGNRTKSISFEYTIDKDLSIENFLKNISLKNLTTHQVVTMPANGEPPYAVIVPIYFKYPLEKIRITNAYPQFIEWARNRDNNRNWYLFEETDNVFQNVK